MFINAFLLNLVEFPGVFLAIWLIETKFGRRWTSFSSFMICGIALIIPTIMPTQNPIVITILTLVGKLSITAAHLVIYQQATELFPTNLRDQSISLANCIRKVFQVAIPYIAILGRQAQWLPLLILAIFSLVSAFLQIFLPETLNEPLPQTISEAEHIGSDKKFFSFAKMNKKNVNSGV